MEYCSRLTNYIFFAIMENGGSHFLVVVYTAGIEFFIQVRHSSLWSAVDSGKIIQLTEAQEALVLRSISDSSQPAQGIERPARSSHEQISFWV